MQQAACKDRTDLDWFDTDCYLNAVLTICRTCPVKQPCLNYAITHQLTDGVWGGYWGQRLKDLGGTHGEG